MLAAHPDVETTSEPWFLIPLVYTLKDHGVYAEFSFMSLRRTVKHLLDNLPNGRQDYYEAIRNFSETLYSKLNKNNARFFLDKTPRYYLIAEDIARIFPNGKFIFLYRNPISVLASTIASFYGNRLGDPWHKIDLYKGPSLLSRASATLKNKSIAIQYEELVRTPEPVLQSICEYMDIPFSETMIEKFTKVPITGMGDKVGYTKYEDISEESLHKWRRILNTPFRQKYALKYIQRLGENTIRSFGYDMAQLIDDIRSFQPTGRGSLADRFNLAKCHLYTIFEMKLITDKIRQHFKEKHNLFMHF